MTDSGGRRKPGPGQRASKASGKADGRGPRPRGDVRPQSTIERRRAFVETLMTRFPDAEAVILAAEESEYRVKRRTCERDMAKIRKRWIAEAEPDHRFLRARHRRNLARLRELAERKGRLATAARLAIHEAAIDGVSPKLSVELGGKVDVGVELDLSRYTVEQLRDIKALQAIGRG